MVCVTKKGTEIHKETAKKIQKEHDMVCATKEGTEIHKETARKIQKEQDMVLKLQITCNKKKSRLYSKTKIFGKVVGVW